MVVKGIRFSRTKGIGSCSGPSYGPTYVEVMVYDDEGNSSFVLSSICDNYLTVISSDYPLFDIEVNAMNGGEANLSTEMDKVAKHIRKREDYDVYDAREEGYGRRFSGLEKAVDLSVMILRKDWEEPIKIEDFIDTYKDKDIDEMNIPYEPFTDQYDD